MPVDTVLFNAKIYTSQGMVEAGVAINEEKITKIAKRVNLPPASKMINLHGSLVLPGLIDSHVHFRDQQLAYREDFTTGTAAAAAGGVTTVVDMPNNRPVTMDVQSLRERMQLAENRILVNVAFFSALPQRTAEIPNIVREGAVGFKLFLLEQIGGVNIDDDDALENAFRTVAEANVPIAVHAEDKSTVEKAKKKLQETDRNDLKAFSDAHPTSAEMEAIQRVAGLAKVSGSHVHICHVTSKEALHAIQEARIAKAKITCEVTPHHLLLTTKILRRLGNVALMLPPLRAEADTEALWRALRQGLIETIASDHAPHSKDEKTGESIWTIKPGIAGIETLLPLMLTEIHRGRLQVADLVRLTCENPAWIFNLRNRGKLGEGCPADIVVVDVDREGRIDASEFKSKAKFSPFDGRKILGKPVKTFVNGQLVMDEGQIVAEPGTGRIVR